MSSADIAKINEILLGNEPKAELPPTKNLDLYSTFAGANIENDQLIRSEFEQDLLTKTSFELVQKYGQEVIPYLDLAVQARGQYLDDRLAQRTNGQAILDTTKDIFQGGVNTIGGIGVFGLDLINDDLGVASAEALDSFNKAMNESGSYALQARQRAQQARLDRYNRISEKQYEQDIAAGKTESEARLAQLGRDYMNTIATYDDPMLLTSGISQAGGSLAVMGTVSKILGAVGKGVLTKAGVPVSEKVAKVGEAIRWPTVSGVVEAGGAYSQAVADVMAISTDQLEKTSPIFNDLVKEYKKEGLSDTEAKEEAKKQIAIMVGNRASAAAGATGFGMGFATKGFENPMAKRNLAKSVTDIISETLEETSIGLTSQLGQNYGKQQFVDKNQNIIEDVGEQMATGTLFSLGSSGVLQAPHIVRESSKIAGRTALNTVDKGLDKLFNIRRDKLESQDENSIDKVATKSNDLVQEINNIPEPTKEVTQFKDNFLQVSETEKETLGRIGQVVAKSRDNRIDIIQALIEKLPAYKDNANILAEAQADILRLFDGLSEDHIENSSIANTEEGQKLIQAKQDLLNSLKSSPQFTRVYEEIQKNMGKIASNVKEITDKSVQTEQGKVEANAVAESAINDIHTADSKLIDKILEHAKKGTLKFAPSVQKALDTINSIIQIENNQLNKLIKAKKIPADYIKNKDKYFRETQFAVHDNITAGDALSYRAANLLSATQHAGMIMRAIRMGDIEQAREQMGYFENFIESQENKAKLAQAYLDNSKNNTGTYTTYNPRTHEAYDQTITFTSKGLARQILDEVKTLQSIQETLYQAYPNEIGTDLTTGSEPIFDESTLEKEPEQQQIEQPEILPKKTDAQKATANIDKALGKTENKKETKVEPTKETKSKTKKKAESKVFKKEEKSAEQLELDFGSEEQVVSEVKQEPKKEEKQSVQEVKKELVKQETKVVKEESKTENKKLSEVISKSLAEDIHNNISRLIALNESLSKNDIDLLDSIIENAQNKLINSGDFNQFINTLNNIKDQFKEQSLVIETINNIIESTNDVKVAYELEVPAKEENNIIKNIKKLFHDTIAKGFKTKPNLTNYSEEDSPIFKIWEQITSDSLPEKILNRLDNTAKKIWKSRLNPTNSKSFVYQMSLELDKQLNAFLNKPFNGKDGPTRKDVYDSNQFNNWRQGKGLNFTERDKDGNIVYNEYFKQMAILASMAWLSANKNVYRKVEPEDIPAMFGSYFNISDFSPKELARINSQMSATSVSLGLNEYVEKFMGLQSDPDASMSFNREIISAMTTNLIEAMVTLGYLQQDVFKKSVDKFDENGNLSYVQDENGNWVPEQEHGSTVLFSLKRVADTSYDDFLSDLVLKEPEKKHYYDDENVPVNNRYLHSMRKITDFLAESIANLQKSKYTFNGKMINLVNAMGEDGINKFFRADIDNPQLYNDRDLESRQGKQLAFTSSFVTLRSNWEDRLAYAKANGKTIWEVAKRYQYRMSAVNRHQQQGSNNPQSDKIMREIDMPTESKDFDMTNQRNEELWYIAVGQAFGIKVQNKKIDDIKKEVDEQLKQLDNSIKELFTRLQQEYLKTESEMDHQNGGSFDETFTFKFSNTEIQQIIDAFDAAGVDRTAVALHAYLDHINLELVKASGNEDALKHYTTKLYIEADGVTNGAANLLATVSLGKFTLKWLKMMRKVGLGIGDKHYIALSDLRINEDGTVDTDVYGQGADDFVDNLREYRKGLNDEVKELQDITLNFIKNFPNKFGTKLSYDSETAWDTDKVWSIHRNIVKSPLTVLQYGAGLMRISSNYAGEVIKGFYAQLSDVAHNYHALEEQLGKNNVTIAQAFFPGVSKDIAEANFKNWLNSINIILATGTKYEPIFDESGHRIGSELVITQLENARLIRPDEINTIEKLKKFVLTPAQERALKNNIHVAFGKPIGASLKNTLGSDVAYFGELVTTATNMMAEIFIKRVNDDKQKARTEKTDKTLLSQNELDEIEWKHKVARPRFFLAGGRQEIDVLGSKRTAVEGDTTSFSGKFTSYAKSIEPDLPGVKAIPYSNISKDGFMIALMSVLEQSLAVFDGFNMALANADFQSIEANKAVKKVWNQNPYYDFYKQFHKFMEDFTKNPTILDVDEPVLPDNPTKKQINEYNKKVVENEQRLKSIISMARKLGIETDRKTIDTLINQIIVEIDNQLLQASNQVFARHNVLNRVPLMIDQMASVGKGYRTQKDFMYTEDIPQGHILAAMNIMYESAIKAEDLQPTISFMEALQQVNKEYFDKTFKPTPYKKLKIRLDELTSKQKSLFNLIKRISGEHIPTVYIGSIKQIRMQAVKDGITDSVFLDRIGTTNDAFYNPEINTIYSTKNDMDVILHEYIHAVTSDIISAYYKGVDLPVHSIDAIHRLEQLMLDFEFSDIELSINDTDIRNAVVNLKELLASSKDNSFRLNEFIAYVLGDPKLYDLMQKHKAPKTLTEYAKKTWYAIKQVIFGKARVAIPKNNDFLSHVRFNTLILVKEQSTLQQQLNNVILEHLNESGDSRLNNLLNQFKELIAYNLNITQNIDRKAEVDTLISSSIENVMKARAAGFKMNQVQIDTYLYMTAAYKAGLAINSDYLDELSRMYDHIMKHISYESFMVDPTSQNINDIKDATEKYNYIKGLTHNFDQLSEFMSLATVSPEFRSVLNKVPEMAELKSTAEGKFDQAVENFGFSLLNRLSNNILGKKKAIGTQKRIDQLIDDLYITVAQQQSQRKFYKNKAGELLEKSNDFITETMDTVGKKLTSFGSRIGENSKQGTVKSTISKVTELAGQAMIHDEVIEESVKKSTLALMNMTSISMLPGSHLLKDLVSDFVGYLKETSSITDLIKTVKSKIQQFRQIYKDKVPQILRSKFKRELTKEQLATLTRSLAKTDLSALNTRTFNNIISLIKNDSNINKELDNLSSDITVALSTVEKAIVINKMNQLAHFMMTGETGGYLLRNANAIADLALQNKSLDAKKIDEYVSLKAFSLLSDKDKSSFRSLLSNERDGVFALYSYIFNLKNTDKNLFKNTLNKENYNTYKGYIPPLKQENISIIVANKKDRTKLEMRGYEYVKDYHGFNTKGTNQKAYFKAPFNSNVSFTEGIMQTTAITKDGINISTGRSIHNTAGVIAGKYHLNWLKNHPNIAKRDSSIMPVFNKDGDVVAYERTTDPMIMRELYKEDDITQSLGIWAGRQQEEQLALEYNTILVDRLFDAWQNETTENGRAMYVNLFESTDPVIKDALSIINQPTLAYINKKFGNKFMVRADLVKDVLGERHASIGDLWTGNTRWSEETQQAVQKAAIAIMGTSAYRRLMIGERWTQGSVALVRQNIVIRSLVVPALNIMSNLAQLMYRGVPIWRLKDAASKVRELEVYIRNSRKMVELNVELGTKSYSLTERRFVEKRIESLQKVNESLSIWPLLNQGEFSTIADVGASQEELEFTPGKLGEYMEAQFNKLPPYAQVISKNLFMTKDTALYKAAEKSVQYGDFIAKAILFDHLTQDKGISQEDALRAIREEFVDYDKLAGRDRQYLEDIGLLWFYNYKLRMAKIAFSILKNNPLHALLVMNFLPDSTIFGNMGDPLTDNIWAKTLDGKIGYSIGPAMMLSGAELHPALNAASAIF